MSLPFLTTSFCHCKVTQYSPKPRVAAHAERMEKRQKSESRNGKSRTKFAPNSHQIRIKPNYCRSITEFGTNHMRMEYASPQGLNQQRSNAYPSRPTSLSTYVDMAPPHRRNATRWTDTPPRTQPTFFTLRHAPSPSNFLFRVTLLFASP